MSDLTNQAEETMWAETEAENVCHKITSGFPFDPFPEWIQLVATSLLAAKAAGVAEGIERAAKEVEHAKAQYEYSPITQAAMQTTLRCIKALLPAEQTQASEPDSRQGYDQTSLNLGFLEGVQAAAATVRAFRTNAPLNLEDVAMAVEANGSAIKAINAAAAALGGGVDLDAIEKRWKATNEPCKCGQPCPAPLTELGEAARTDIPALIAEVRRLQEDRRLFRQRIYGLMRVKGPHHSTACAIWGNTGQGGTAEGFAEPLPCTCGALVNHATQRADAAEKRAARYEVALRFYADEREYDGYEERAINPDDGVSLYVKHARPPM